MRKKLSVFIALVAVLFSCSQSEKPTKDTVKVTSSNSKTGQKSLPAPQIKFDTQYEYTDASGKSFIVQNSFPKSGINYTAPNGEKYVYAVFWTQLTNKTAHPCEFTIDFPAELKELPSAPNVYFKFFLPPDTMTIAKEPLYNYGLTHLKSILDTGLSQPSSLKRTVNAKESTAFYVVTLSNKGVGSPLRTGFSIKDQNLIYKINKTEFHCGKINLDKLVLKE